MGYFQESHNMMDKELGNIILQLIIEAMLELEVGKVDYHSIIEDQQL